MIKIKNNRKITIQVFGKEIGPFGTLDVEKSVWEKEYASNKTIREALRLGFISAKQDKKIEKKEKK